MALGDEGGVAGCSTHWLCSIRVSSGGPAAHLSALALPRGDSRHGLVAAGRRESGCACDRHVAALDAPRSARDVAARGGGPMRDATRTHPWLRTARSVWRSASSWRRHVAPSERAVHPSRDKHVGRGWPTARQATEPAIHRGTSRTLGAGRRRALLATAQPISWVCKCALVHCRRERRLQS